MDANLISDILNILGTGLKTTDAAATIAIRVKGLFKSPQSAAHGEIESLMADLVMQIADTKLANAELKIKLTQLLEAANAEHDSKAKLAQYVLRKTQNAGFVYVVKDLPATDKGFHMICPNCYENGVRSILQGGGYDIVCPRCKAEIPNTPMTYSC